MASGQSVNVSKSKFIGIFVIFTSLGIAKNLIHNSKLTRLSRSFFWTLMDQKNPSNSVFLDNFISRIPNSKIFWVNKDGRTRLKTDVMPHAPERHVKRPYNLLGQKTPGLTLLPPFEILSLISRFRRFKVLFKGVDKRRRKRKQTSSNYRIDSPLLCVYILNLLSEFRRFKVQYLND